MIPQAEVFRLARREGVGDRIIEKDYVLSWALIAIAESDLRGHVAFKGGTALKKVYFPGYRFSEDLDFTLPSDLPHDELVRFLSALLNSLQRRVNLRVELARADLTKNESTAVEVAYVGPLLATAQLRRLKMDFTRGELLVNAPREAELKAPYSDYPKAVRLPAYTINEILAEKLCALMGRTEPRDLYDVWSLFERGVIDGVLVTHDFLRKAEHKGHDPARLYQVLGEKDSRGYGSRGCRSKCHSYPTSKRWCARCGGTCGNWNSARTVRTEPEIGEASLPSPPSPPSLPSGPPLPSLPHLHFPCCSSSTSDPLLVFSRWRKKKNSVIPTATATTPGSPCAR